MPDQIDRDKQERAAAAAILLLFADLGSRLATFDAQAFTERAAASLEPVLGEVYTNAQQRMIDSLDLDWEGKLPKTKWAARHARRVGRELASTINSEVKALRKRGPLDPAEVEKILTKARADRVATTEVTTAISNGEIDAAEVLKKVLGAKPDAIWRAERNACRLCKKMDGKRRRVWSRRYPDGPPSPHPNCKCYLEWVLAGRR